LRFTVYSNDWFLEKLDNVCQFVRDGTHGSFKDVEIGIPLLSAKDIFDGKININENSRLISIDDYNTIHKNYELTKGDILLTIVGTIGRTAMVNMDEKFTLQRSVAILRVNEQISYNFLYYYIQTSAFQNRLKSVVNQSAQGGVYLNSLKKLNIKLTADMNEQNKISSFLSIIDKKIELLEQKYQYYQEFKKYLMQQIFTQKLRFNFTDEWDKVLLKDVAFIPKKTKLTNIEGLKLLTVKLHTKGIEINDRIKPKLTKRGRPYYIRRSGELLIGRQNFHNGGMGIVPKSLDGGICSNAISSFNVFEDKIDVNYLYYFLARPEYYIKSERLIGGTGQKEFSEKELLKLKIDLPSLEEQNKIVDFLSNIDHKIELSENQLNKTQEFKKGLLQQMFIVQLILSLLQNKKHI
jgi:type I restriction enzyme S subunit